MTALQFGISSHSMMRGAATKGGVVSGDVSRTRLHLTRRGRVVVSALVVLPLVATLSAFAILGGSSAVAGASTDSNSVAFSYVTVQPGQSLWAIAEKLNPSADPRDVIAEIVNLNQLQTSEVQSGQRLALPAEYSK